MRFAHCLDETLLCETRRYARVYSLDERDRGVFGHNSKLLQGANLGDLYAESRQT